MSFTYSILSEVKEIIFFFHPRDGRRLSVRVCLSVTSGCSVETDGRNELLLSTYSTLRDNEILVKKQGYLPLQLYPTIWTYKFFCHGTSIIVICCHVNVALKAQSITSIYCRSGVHLLYNKLYSRSTAKRRVWDKLDGVGRTKLT